MEKIIKNKLAALSPAKLELVNESHKHMGHVGWNKSGNTHFNLLIVSDAFIDQNKVKRHKMIYLLLAKELKEQIHALSIRAFTKDEWNQLH
jgi:BolA protein